MHLKRQQSPKNWPTKRKGTTYIVRPRYNINGGLPISIIMRDVLGFAKTRREVKKAINLKQILLNNKQVLDERSNALLFDIITIIPPKESNLPEKFYRIEIGENKKFKVEEIKKEESIHKIAKIINKKTLKGNRIQINLSDGRNFISDSKYKVNDSLMINLKDKKIEKHFPLKENVNAIIFAGKHAGEKGIIKEIDEKNGRAKLDIKGESTSILIKQLMVTE